MYKLHEPYLLKNSLKYIHESLEKGVISGDGTYTSHCQDWLMSRLNAHTVLMTTSCTHAIELAMNIIGLKKDDEVILPSFTFPSTANGVLLAGAKVVYSEVEQKHLTIDPDFIEEKITDRTKAVIVVHYGGICCDMDKIMAIAKKYDLIVVEDGAQSFLSAYKGQFAGTIGHFGCLSFHGTKDITSGEGGAIIINDDAFLEKSRVFRQKGTNRDAFNLGQVGFYEWVYKGSSYTPSDILMALLYGQLESSDIVLKIKKELFLKYEEFFKGIESDHIESFSSRRGFSEHNGHLFYVVFSKEESARKFQKFLENEGIQVLSHFVPLHESQMGQKYIRKINHFRYESGLGKRLMRLPLHAQLTFEDIDYITSKIKIFFEECL